jgi:hypothetical protein
MRDMRLLAPIVLASLVFSTAAGASITSTSGDAQEASAPASVKLGANESDTTMTTFDERQCVSLSQPLQVDITRRAVVNRRHELTPGVVGTGVSVSSHFVHVDPVGRKLITLTGRLTTDERILGVIVTRQRLDASDFLGAAGTSYSTNAIGRQMEPGSDAVDISDDRHAVRIKSTAGVQFDQLRVITRCGETTEAPAKSQGCTAGFWRQQHVDSWPAYSPSDHFEAVFGVDAFIGDPTLAEALHMGGGSTRALARQAVAALLNASSSDIDYELTSAEVIALTADALRSKNARSVAHLTNRLERLNRGSCYLG